MLTQLCLAECWQQLCLLPLIKLLMIVRCFFSMHQSMTNWNYICEQALLTTDSHLFQMQSTELADACHKLLPDPFDGPFCQLIQCFASHKDRPEPGLLNKLFAPSNTG